MCQPQTIVAGLTDHAAIMAIVDCEAETPPYLVHNVL